MSVVIGSVTLSEVLNWKEETTVSVPIKSVVRKTTPTVQSEYFARLPKMITIEARCTRTIKADLEDLRDEFRWHVLLDYDGTFVAYVWIEQLSPSWRGDIDYDYPWLVQLRLISTECGGFPYVFPIYFC